MRIEYEEQTGRSFLTVIPEQKNIMESFPYRMVKENHIEQLIPFHVREINGEEKLYFDITSMETVKAFYENRDMNYEDCKNILLSIQKMLWRMQEYLLDGEQISLQETEMFWNYENNSLCFLFLPSLQQNLSVSFRNLAEFMLEKVNHEDHRAVRLAYHFYKTSRKENFSLTMVIQQINALEEDMDSSYRNITTEQTMLLPKTEEMTFFDEPGEEKHDPPDNLKSGLFTKHMKAGLSGLLALVFCGLYLLCPLRKVVADGCLFLGVVLAVAAVCFEVSLKTAKTGQCKTECYCTDPAAFGADGLLKSY